MCHEDASSSICSVAYTSQRALVFVCISAYLFISLALTDVEEVDSSFISSLNRDFNCGYTHKTKCFMMGCDTYMCAMVPLINVD